MRTVHYPLRNGGRLAVLFDPTAPCIVCGLAVEHASMGGTNVCPACDCGNYRDGSQFEWQKDGRWVPVFDARYRWWFIWQQVAGAAMASELSQLSDQIHGPGHAARSWETHVQKEAYNEPP